MASQLWHTWDPSSLIVCVKTVFKNPSYAHVLSVVLWGWAVLCFSWHIFLQVGCNCKAHRWKVIVQRRKILRIQFQISTGINYEMEKWKISREQPTLYAARSTSQWFLSGLLMYLEVVMNFLTRIVTRSAQTCCTFFSWIIVVTYCWHHRPKIMMILLAWYRKNQKTVPPQIGKLSPLSCWNIADTGKFLLIKHFNFSSAIISSHTIYWIHRI